MTTITPWRWAAIVLAVVVLGQQIVTALEYLEAASISTKCSICLVLVTLAILPKFIEISWHSGVRSLAIVLSLAFGAWFFYSIPSTIGRTGEAKETKVATAQAQGEGRKLLEAELKRARDRVTAAEQSVASACSKTSYSDNCEGWKRTEKERQARVDQIRKELTGTMMPTTGDTGSELLAWALTFLGIAAESIRKASVLAYALGLDVIIWALVWFGTSAKIAAERPAQLIKDEVPMTLYPEQIVPAPGTALCPPSDSPASSRSDGEEPGKLDESAALDDLRAQVAAGQHHGVVEYSRRWRVSKGEASKRITDWEDQGLIGCEQDGKSKLVTHVKLRLVRAA